MRRKDPHKENHERWLVSYADFMTLLFAFFVVLYASSQADRGKMSQLAVAIESAFRNLGVFQGTTSMGAHDGLNSAAAALARKPNILPHDAALGGYETLRKELERSLSMQIQRKSISLDEGPDGLIIRLREMAFYKSGSADLRPESLPTLRVIADVLSRYGSDLRIEGHTDDVPIHTLQFDSNWELSTARATGMVKLFASELQFPAARVSAAGFAEFHPVATNATEGGRRLNRRVDIVVLRRSSARPTASATPAEKREAMRSTPEVSVPSR